MKIKPLSNNVVVEPLKDDEKTKGGILLPQSAGKERPQQGKVISVGPGKMSSQGKLSPMTVKKGDIVLFNKYNPNEVKVGDKEYLILSQDDILGTIEE